MITQILDPTHLSINSISSLARGHMYTQILWPFTEGKKLRRHCDRDVEKMAEYAGNENRNETSGGRSQTPSSRQGTYLAGAI